MQPEELIKQISNECKKSTPERIIKQIAELRGIAMEAAEKIKTEGTVVRTLKGDVIAHPAIKIHADTIKNESMILNQWQEIKR